MYQGHSAIRRNLSGPSLSDNLDAVGISHGGPSLQGVGGSTAQISRPSSSLEVFGGQERVRRKRKSDTTTSPQAPSSRWVSRADFSKLLAL